MVDTHTCKGTEPVGTTVQLMPGLHRIMDTRQVREYANSTISKVLTVLKWQIIPTLNTKLLGKVEGIEPLCFL